MMANFEQRKYPDNCKVWLSKQTFMMDNLPHWHEEYELLYIHRGKYRITVDRAEYTGGAGDAFLIDSCKLHSILLPDDCDCDIILFSREIIDEFCGRELASPKLSVPEKVAGLYDMLIEEINARRPYYDIKTSNIIRNAMIDILRDEKTKPRGREQDSEFSRYKTLLQLLDKNLAAVTFEEAANIMCYSKSYFSKFFHSLTGVTFSQYQNILKTQKAIDLLKSNERLTMTDISLRAGFPTIRQFNRVFKEYTGFAPRELPKNFIFNPNRLKRYQGNSMTTVVPYSSQ